MGTIVSVRWFVFRRIVFAFSVAVMIAVGSAVPTDVAARAVSSSLTLTGAGSTFDFPLFSDVFAAYTRNHPTVRVDYQPIGSSRGIRAFTAQTVDFGASDVPMSAAELTVARGIGGPVVQFPVALGAVAVVYNLPGLKGPGSFKLTAAALAGIYLGKIVSWKDPAIAGPNKQLQLPNLPIIVVHRSDGSGTTYIFTDYLSHVSATWQATVGAAQFVLWPTGLGGQGSAGVAGQVEHTPGAIGYVELAYAMQNHMSTVMLQNRAAAFISPSLATTRAAAVQVPMIDATHFSIVDAPGAQSYPIAGYSWALIYQRPPDATRGAALVSMMKWLVTGGQAHATALNYVPLPPTIQKLALTSLAGITTH